MKTGKSIKGALNYNEQKVRQGTAELILASRFSRDVSEMGFSEKLLRFEKLTQLNDKSKTNTLHLSLNFSPDDCIDTETMQQIAADYMNRIGFGKQPYLVYQHNDTAHPHLHIVTTTIRPDGKPIYLHNIGKRLSEPARKAIELEYGLIRAESRKQSQVLPLKPIPLQAANYGQSETKRLISNIVTEVVARYRFASLHELNTVLRQFNVIADRGNLNSSMYQNRGLVYSIVDKDGYKTGVPIKASSIFTSPTLSVLENKFEKNKVTKPLYQKRVQTRVLSILAKSDTSNRFMEGLKANNIGCSVQYKTDGTINNIGFVDHNSKAVVSCEDLGISVNSLLNRLNHPQSNIAESTDKTTHSPDNEQNSIVTAKYSPSFDLFKILLTTEAHQDKISPEFLKKKRKKRKR